MSLSVAEGCIPNRIESRVSSVSPVSSLVMHRLNRQCRVIVAYADLQASSRGFLSV